MGGGGAGGLVVARGKQRAAADAEASQALARAEPNVFSRYFYPAVWSSRGWLPEGGRGAEKRELW